MKAIRVNDHVLVLPTTANGQPHPHAGKTGIVTELMGIHTQLFNPVAHVRIDPHCDFGGNIMIVGLASLERIP